MIDGAIIINVMQDAGIVLWQERFAPFILSKL